MMPNMDGFELTRRLRQDPRTAAVSIIMLTARGLSADKLEGFAIGADDYIVKPFDTPELLARIRGVLRRAHATCAPSRPSPASPATSGSRRRSTGGSTAASEFAILYADLDHFKAYNDHYGFMRGDQVIQATAGLIEDVAREITDGDAFVGHVGGDDFVVVVDPPEKAAAVAEAIVERFDQRRRTLYDDDDRDARLHRGREPPRRAPAVPACPISIGVATHREARFAALRRGRGRRDRDEAVHEGRHRLVVGDRPPNAIV